MAFHCRFFCSWKHWVSRDEIQNCAARVLCKCRSVYTCSVRSADGSSFRIKLSYITQCIWYEKRTVCSSQASIHDGNKNILRTIEAQIVRLKNNEPRPRFTGSYKKKPCIEAFWYLKVGNFNCLNFKNRNVAGGVAGKAENTRWVVGTANTFKVESSFPLENFNWFDLK